MLSHFRAVGEERRGGGGEAPRQAVDENQL